MTLLSASSSSTPNTWVYYPDTAQSSNVSQSKPSESPVPHRGSGRRQLATYPTTPYGALPA